MPVKAPNVTRATVATLTGSISSTAFAGAILGVTFWGAKKASQSLESLFYDNITALIAWVLSINLTLNIPPLGNVVTMPIGTLLTVNQTAVDEQAHVWGEFVGDISEEAILAVGLLLTVYTLWHGLNSTAAISAHVRISERDAVHKRVASLTEAEMGAVEMSVVRGRSDSTSPTSSHELLPAVPPSPTNSARI